MTGLGMLGLGILGLGTCGYVLTTRKATLVQKALVIAGVGVFCICVSSAINSTKNQQQGEFEKFMSEIHAEIDTLD